MTSIALARALARTGLAWAPARGDRFVIPDRGMDAEVFVLSDMTIEAHDHPTGRVLGFNGTTEWALDSVAADDALWLPAEGHLREALGDRFAGLTRGVAAGERWRVALADGSAHAADDAEEAYALALLAVRASTARDLLPVAAHGLSSRLRALGPATSPAWTALAPDGVRSVLQVVEGAVGAPAGAAPDPGSGDPRPGWAIALDDLLEAWSGSASGTGAVTEAGARGVLVDLLAATWDVAVATGADDRLDRSCLVLAVEHAASWGGAPADGAAGGAATGADPQRRFLALTGR